MLQEAAGAHYTTMKIVVTYNPAWAYYPDATHVPGGSRNTTDSVAERLDWFGYESLVVPADDELESRLRELVAIEPDSFLFWINDFMPAGSSKRFTREVAEQAGIRSVGPSGATMQQCYDKSRAKRELFGSAGLDTPDFYVTAPPNYPGVRKNRWKGKHVIVKPLLLDSSKGIDISSVVEAADSRSIRRLVDRIYDSFREPSIVEEYIGINNPREFSVPVMIRHDGLVLSLPVVEMDLEGTGQDNIKIITRELKIGERMVDGGYGFYEKRLIVPADLPVERTRLFFHRLAKAASMAGCDDIVRFDVRSDNGILYVLELNATPSISPNASTIASSLTQGIDDKQMRMWKLYQALVREGIAPRQELVEYVKPAIDYANCELNKETIDGIELCFRG